MMCRHHGSSRSTHFFVVIFAPVFAWFWIQLGQKKYGTQFTFENGYGLFLLALGYAWIALGVKDLHPMLK